MDFEKLISGYKKEIIPQFEMLREKETNPQQRETFEQALTILKTNLRSLEIQKRLLDLYINEEYFGYVCFLSQLVEYKTRESIVQYQEIRALLERPVVSEGDLKRATLGSLISKYKEFIKDEGLIEKMKSFNKQRRSAIHNLFDPTVTVERVESEIKNGLIPNTVYGEIINPITEYETVLLVELNKLKHGEQVSGLQGKVLRYLETSCGINIAESRKNVDFTADMTF